MIIGTQKGGTTSLHSYLLKHPGFGPTLTKEIHYFDRAHLPSMRWYQAHFPMRLPRERICIDSTPQYLTHPLVPQRVKEFYPFMKFVVLLRNPVERAYSHYNHRVSRNQEHRRFEDAIDELIKSEGTYASTSEKFEDSGRPEGPNKDFRNYLNRGKYAIQIRNWFDSFSRDQFLILNSEEFFSNPREAIAEVCQFVGVGGDFQGATRVENSGGNYPRMSPEIRETLTSYYESSNDDLYSLLNVDYRW